MYKKLCLVIVMVFGLCGFAQAKLIQISDTQTWQTFADGGFNSNDTLQILAGGHLTVNARSGIINGRHIIVEDGGTFVMNDRLDMDSQGTITMNGGEFYSNVDLKFPDSSGDQDVHIWMYGGLMVCNQVQSFADRGSYLHVGGGVFRIGNTSDTSSDPESDAWNVVLIPPYMEIVFTDIGGGFKEVTGLAPFIALNPSPADGATDVLRDVVLSWTPAPIANAHDVYFGTVLDDVNNADRTNPLGVLAGQSQTADTYDPPGLLEFGQTYYWRIDEVNDADPASPWKGKAWSFTVEPYSYAMENVIATASTSQSDNTGPQKTIDGSGLSDGDLHSTNAKDMWLSSAEPLGAWIQYEFDGIYTLHEMWVWNQNQVVEGSIGFGAKDVTIEYSTDGVDWLALGDFEFAQAPGLDDYAHNTTVDFGGVPAKYVRLTINSNWGGIVPQYGLSEVRFLYIPTYAREPKPVSGATGVNVDVVLSWRAGRKAASHEIYLGSVIDDLALVGTVSESRYDLGLLDLQLGETYYWKVNEVNETAEPSIWEGDIWTFSIQEYLVVDDFESYNDLDPGDPESNRIFNAWIDGYEVPTNGSLVGYDVLPFAEQTIVHGGRQSMPFHYGQDNAANSEATLTFASTQDWTRAGAATLVLYFYGEPSNTGGQLYVKINGTKVIHTGAIAQPYWKQWNIDLVSVGADLQNVTSMSIGVDGAGSSGLLYIDDILLYKEAPGMASEQIWIEAESANTITLPMEVFTGDAASGGQFIGTRNGIGGSDDNPPADGIASYSFTVAGGTYKIQLRVNGNDGNSLWVRIPGATTNIKIHESGWVLNGTPGENYWNWDDVTSRDGDGDTVHFTLGPGTHTLDITYREDGCLLDSIVITDKLD
ncbi:MAG: discoidin domain-containing protein [Planctomycetota bacterium]